MIKKYSTHIIIALACLIAGAAAGFTSAVSAQKTVDTVCDCKCPDPTPPIMLQSIDWAEVKKARIRDFTYAPQFHGKFTITQIDTTTR